MPRFDGAYVRNSDWQIMQLSTSVKILLAFSRRNIRHNRALLAMRLSSESILSDTIVLDSGIGSLSFCSYLSASAWTKRVY